MSAKAPRLSLTSAWRLMPKIRPQVSRLLGFAALADRLDPRDAEQFLSMAGLRATGRPAGLKLYFYGVHPWGFGYRQG